MICPTKNDGFGTSSAYPVPKNEEKPIPDPKRKRVFVPYAFGRKARFSTQPSLTASDRKKFQEFAAKAKAISEERKKSKFNI